MNDLPQNPQKPSPSIILVFVLVVAILIAGGVYLYGQNQENENSNTNIVITNQNSNGNGNSAANTNQSANTNLVVNTNATVPDDWETYTNNNLGISFRYPEGWDVKEYGAIDARTLGYVAFGPEPLGDLGDMRATVTASVLELKLSGGFTMADLAAEMELAASSSSTTEIDGKQALLYDARAGETLTKGAAILIDEKTKRVYHLVATGEDYFGLFSEMLSTLVL